MTHTIFAFFVWARSTHAMSSRGKSACTVSFFLWKSSALVCPSFRLLPAIRDPRCRGTEEIEIMGFAVGSGRWVRERALLLRTSAENEGELLDHPIQWLVLCMLCPGRAGDVWGWGSWDWTLSLLLPCVWWVIGGYGASKIIQAINPQLEWAFLFFLIFMRRLRRSEKSYFFSHS